MQASTWMDQFVLRERGPAEVLTPFRQVLAAAHMLIRVSEDRTGLTTSEYDVVGSARYEAMLLSELAHQLDEQVARLVCDADRSRSAGANPDRILTVSLTGVMRTTATLVDVCLALLGVSESLLVVRAAKSRVELAAAVETLRAAVGTSQITLQANLSRITDSRTYDQLAEGLPAFDLIREQADRVARTLRDKTAPVGFPAQLTGRFS